MLPFFHHDSHTWTALYIRHADQYGAPQNEYLTTVEHNLEEVLEYRSGRFSKRPAVLDFTGSGPNLSLLHAMRRSFRFMQPPRTIPPCYPSLTFVRCKS